MDEGRFSGSAASLYDRRGTTHAQIPIDVRRMPPRLTAGRTIGRPAVDRSRQHPVWLSRLAALVRLWLARSRQRRVLYEIAQRNDYLLKDIGISQPDAFREAEKPFWRP
jgi:uncharacterized protein YjiS (DUF1127 family)